MNHRRARKRLPGLLDGTLGSRAALAVREHARGCRSCRRRLREHQAAEVLVRLLPQALLPYEPSPAADVRLWSLSRWSVDPLASWRRERFSLGAVGVGIALAAYALSASMSTWTPLWEDPGALMTLAQSAPDTSALLPLGWR